MKLTFLGTSAAWPTAGHNNVCFVVHAREPVLFECGPSILHQLAVAGVEPHDIRTVIVSHIHGDHSLGIPMFVLIAQIGGRQSPLTICMPESAIAPMKRICTTVFPGTGKVLNSLIEWIPLPERGSGTFGLPGKASASTARGEHPVPVVSTHVRFESEQRTLAFSGDTAYCERVGLNAEGADLLIHESNWSDALKTGSGHGHSSAADAGAIAALAKAKRLALVHTGRELAGHERDIEAEAAARFSGEVFAPADFSTIDF
ncbi:MAG TPA: ribonuclease Z [Chloroflexota bacterium]|nr:ribonuclease Z [Chloroflexota bacterium]